MGSVIWHALRQATLRREQLPGLRSWTTVGTPFLHDRTRGAWSLANIGSLVLALLLLNPASKAFFGFFTFILAAVLGSHATLDVRSDQQVLAVRRAPIFALLEWVNVPIEDEAALSVLVPVDELVRRLRDAGVPRLIYLASCHGQSLADETPTATAAGQRMTDPVWASHAPAR